LAGDKALDITDLIKTDGAKFKINGELLRLVGLSSATKSDVSEPGLLLVFE
jgi:hypothetical protein